MILHIDGLYVAFPDWQTGAREYESYLTPGISQLCMFTAKWLLYWSTLAS